MRVLTTSAAGYFGLLIFDGGVVDCYTADASSSPSGPAGGDLAGTYPNPNVANLEGNALNLPALGAGQDGFVLTWDNATSRLRMLAPTGGPPSGAAGGDLAGTYPDPRIGELQGFVVSAAAPQEGDVLRFTGGQWVNDATLTILVATVDALQAQVTALSQGNGFNLSDLGSGLTANLTYQGTTIGTFTT